MKIRPRGDEFEAVAVNYYYPKNQKRRHFFDEFSKQIFSVKKYRDEALIDELARKLAAVVKEEFAGEKFDFITIPPPSRKRLYYPCAHLAQAVAVNLDIDLVECLEWKERVGSQHKRINAALKSQRFHELAVVTKDVAGACILLFDDILTSGLTARACVRALRQAGAESVFVAVGGYTAKAELSAMEKMKAKVLKKKREIVRKKMKQIHAVKKQKEFITRNTKTKGVNDGGG